MKGAYTCYFLDIRLCLVQFLFMKFFSFTFNPGQVQQSRQREHDVLMSMSKCLCLDAYVIIFMSIYILCISLSIVKLIRRESRERWGDHDSSTVLQLGWLKLGFLNFYAFYPGSKNSGRPQLVDHIVSYCQIVPLATLDRYGDWRNLTPRFTVNI